MNEASAGKRRRGLDVAAKEYKDVSRISGLSLQLQPKRAREPFFRKDDKMKPIRFTNILVLGLVLTLAASGCRKHPWGVTDIHGRTGQAGGGGDNNQNALGSDTNGVSSASTGIPANPADSHQGWTENAEPLKANTVHFAFDSSVVKDSEKGNVTAVADYLKSHAEAAVKIEGHCDERGTAEYNRSLGERRASALRESLVAAGIEASRVDTISYGFDRPVDPGHNEAAWSKNRRGEFIVLTPPGK
jgi:peptidoglycan-associated lipoprotein